MWDVKDEVPAPQVINTYNTFYLDYVGCKVRRIYGSQKYELSFISTMWDVKKSQQTGKLYKVQGFISTMWDVKHPP